MRKSVKLWIKALRSGKYKRGENKLWIKSNNTFCCLGVACDLYNKTHKNKVVLTGDAIEDCLEGRFVKVLNWLGLKDDTGSYKSKSAYVSNTSLALENDAGKSFKQISDIIESCPEGLFKGNKL